MYIYMLILDSNQSRLLLYCFTWFILLSQNRPSLLDVKNLDLLHCYFKRKKSSEFKDLAKFYWYNPVCKIPDTVQSDEIGCMSYYIEA